MMHAGVIEQQDQEHQAGNEPMHEAPVIPPKGKVGHQPAADVHRTEDEDVKHGEEVAEIACRRNPELHGGHTFKRAFELADTFDEA